MGGQDEKLDSEWVGMFVLIVIFCIAIYFKHC